MNTFADAESQVKWRELLFIFIAILKKISKENSFELTATIFLLLSKSFMSGFVKH